MRVIVIFVITAISAGAHAQPTDLYLAFKYCYAHHVDDLACEIVINKTPQTPFYYKQHTPLAEEYYQIPIEQKKTVIRRVAKEMIDGQ